MTVKTLPASPGELLKDLMMTAQYFDDCSVLYLGEGRNLLVCDKPPVPAYRISIPDEFGNPLISMITEGEALTYLEGFFE